MAIKRRLSPISIIIPMRNSRSTIGECLSSVMKQDYPKYEVIVVDDCSTDDSVRIVKGYDCRLIRLKERMGPGGARNAGIKKTKYELLAFTDSDCILPKNWLLKITKYMKQDGIVGVSGGYAFSAGKEFIAMMMYYDLLYRQKSLPKYINSSITSNFGCKKKEILKVGGFPDYAKGYGNEDMEIGYLMTRDKKNSLIWINDNGVGHHFRKSLWSYLKQQFYFSSAIIRSYLRFPSQLFLKSNYSKSDSIIQIILFTILVFSIIFSIWKPLLLFLSLGIATFYLIFYLPLFRLIKKSGEDIIFITKTYFSLILRNFFWILGIIYGFIIGIKEVIFKWD